MSKRAVRRYPCRLIPITYSNSLHFHGGNTGSNPVGDANKINDLLESGLLAEGLIGFDKKDSLARRLLFPCLLARHENHFDKLCLRCALRRSAACVYVWTGKNPKPCQR